MNNNPLALNKLIKNLEWIDKNEALPIDIIGNLGQELQKQLSVQEKVALLQKRFFTVFTAEIAGDASFELPKSIAMHYSYYRIYRYQAAKPNQSVNQPIRALCEGSR